MSELTPVQRAYQMMAAAWPHWAARQTIETAREWCRMLSDVTNLVEAVEHLAKRSPMPPAPSEIREVARGLRERRMQPKPLAGPELTAEEFEGVSRELEKNVRRILDQGTIGGDAARAILDCARRQRGRLRIPDADWKRRAAGDDDD